MSGAFCHHTRITIGDSGPLEVQVLYQITAAWPQDNNPESPDPGERASAEITWIKRADFYKELNLKAPILQPVIADLERKLIESFQWN